MLHAWAFAGVSFTYDLDVQKAVDMGLFGVRGVRECHMSIDAPLAGSCVDRIEPRLVGIHSMRFSPHNCQLRRLPSAAHSFFCFASDRGGESSSTDRSSCSGICSSSCSSSGSDSGSSSSGYDAAAGNGDDGGGVGGSDGRQVLSFHVLCGDQHVEKQVRALIASASTLQQLLCALHEFTSQLDTSQACNRQLADALDEFRTLALALSQ
jgi:hypothetical protein